MAKKPKARPPRATAKAMLDDNEFRAKADELRTHGRNCELIAELFLALAGVEPSPKTSPAADRDTK